jgi:hypothetical protein
MLSVAEAALTVDFGAGRSVRQEYVGATGRSPVFTKRINPIRHSRMSLSGIQTRAELDPRLKTFGGDASGAKFSSQLYSLPCSSIKDPRNLVDLKSAQ